MSGSFFGYLPHEKREALFEASWSLMHAAIDVLEDIQLGTKVPKDPAANAVIDRWAKLVNGIPMPPDGGLLPMPKEEP